MTAERALAGRFLDAVAACDFDALRALLDQSVAFRALLPSRGLTDVAADEIAATFRRWFGDYPTFRMVDSSIGEVGARTYLRYRIAVAGADGWSDGALVEQHLFLAGSDRVTAVDLMCSGFQPWCIRMS